MPNRRTDHSGGGHCEADDLRALIDGVVWHLDVDSSHPGVEEGPKGSVVRRFKCAGQLSWYGRTAAPREILLYTSSRTRFLNRTSIGERCKHREVWNPNPTQPKNTKPPVFLFENHISLRSPFHFDSQFSSARLLFTPRLSAGESC
ncbi:hypothetical protein HAX54_003721 [Datura stramonium]|uniref:Uncharacterized protein n=1 Tax=Datura stramonium TaxID=4076 RepID=A0ABS8T7Y4_DATST|nr:hypothetical protein [Datura stramonium]